MCQYAKGMQERENPYTPEEQAEIREIAYTIWKENSHHDPVTNWLRAEQLWLMNNSQPNNPTPPWELTRETVNLNKKEKP